MKTIKIPKNWHYAINQLPFIPYFGTRKEKSRIYTFTKSCKYQISETSCVNKLFGWSFGWHHKNSVRVGWSYDNDLEKIVLWSYNYINGSLSKKKIFLCNINEAVNIIIVSFPIFTCGKETIGYEIYINNYLKAMEVTNIPTTKWGYTLEAFFGGKTKAPHSIKIKVTKP